MKRVSKPENRFSEVDFTIPIKPSLIMSKVSEEDCLGQLWDLRNSECSRCAERDICGILFNENKVKPSVAQVQEKQGAIFLDLTDFEAVDIKDMLHWVKSGETTTKELIAYVMGKAKTSDRVAAIAWLKRTILATDSINTKSGIVCLS